MSKRLWAMATVIGLAATAGAADEPITVKVRRPAVGEVVKDTKSETTTVTISAAVNGEQVENKMEDTDRIVFTEEVLERPDGAKRATKLKRTYTTAEGKERGRDADYQLAGKTVLIEKGKDKYEFRIDGKPLAGAGAAKLDKEFNGKKSDLRAEDVLMPKTPVKVGDTWELDPKQVAEVFGEGMELDVKTATGKLVKVYDQNGHKSGVMEFVIEMPLRKGGPDGKTTMREGSFLELKLTADRCIDGTAVGGVLTGTMTAVMKFTEMRVDVTAKLTSILESKTEPVKK